VPKEIRLSRWLCGDALTYENVDTISYDGLYEESARLSIKLRLTEVLKIKGGRLSTRAADAFIHNAQVTLGRYRSNQRPQREISEKDCQKIM
jgi:hypothetical protein